MEIIQKVKDKSLRWKIMVAISLAVIVMSVSLVITMRIDHYALNIIGSSYKTNEELTMFSNDLFQMETSMETYVKYKTFESIDAFYNNSAKVDSFCQKMQSFPSTDTIKQKEYLVSQLAQSFLFYSAKTISSKRANTTSTEVYRKSITCYRTLIDQIASLNILYMRKNADVFEKDRDNVNMILQAYILFFIIFFIFILVFLYYFIGYATKPLVEISKVATRIAEQDFDVPLFRNDTHDEIGNICRAFDRMIISIREYIDKIWEKARTENELREKEMQMTALYADAKLKAYQSQINPHFLFNTLNTGAQLAMMEGADKTCFFIEQTSDFFRYNIQQKDCDVTIEEELGLVDNFVYIMKVRFGKRLEFEKTIEDGVNLSCRLPTMTLQPLVENCIQHGLQNVTGKVMLHARQHDGFVEISVSDNGDGISEEIRKKVLDGAKTNISFSRIDENEEKDAKDEKHTGIGLINVFSRLALYFHRNDIYDIQTNDENDGRGTKFIILVPIENI